MEPLAKGLVSLNPETQWDYGVESDNEEEEETAEQEPRGSLGSLGAAEMMAENGNGTQWDYGVEDEDELLGAEQQVGKGSLTIQTGLKAAGGSDGLDSPTGFWESNKQGQSSPGGVPRVMSEGAGATAASQSQQQPLSPGLVRAQSLGDVLGKTPSRSQQKTPSHAAKLAKSPIDRSATTTPGRSRIPVRKGSMTSTPSRSAVNTPRSRSGNFSGNRAAGGGEQAIAAAKPVKRGKKKAGRPVRREHQQGEAAARHAAERVKGAVAPEEGEREEEAANRHEQDESSDEDSGDGDDFQPPALEEERVEITADDFQGEPAAKPAETAEDSRERIRRELEAQEERMRREIRAEEEMRQKIRAEEEMRRAMEARIRAEIRQELMEEERKKKEEEETKKRKEEEERKKKEEEETKKKEEEETKKKEEERKTKKEQVGFENEEEERNEEEEEEITRKEEQEKRNEEQAVAEEPRKEQEQAERKGKEQAEQIKKGEEENASDSKRQVGEGKQQQLKEEQGKEARVQEEGTTRTQQEGQGKRQAAERERATPPEKNAAWGGSSADFQSSPPSPLNSAAWQAGSAMPHYIRPASPRDYGLDTFRHFAPSPYAMSQLNGDGTLSTPKFAPQPAPVSLTGSGSSPDSGTRLSQQHLAALGLLDNRSEEGQQPLPITTPPRGTSEQQQPSARSNAKPGAKSVERRTRSPPQKHERSSPQEQNPWLWIMGQQQQVLPERDGSSKQGGGSGSPSRTDDEREVLFEELDAADRGRYLGWGSGSLQFAPPADGASSPASASKVPSQAQLHHFQNILRSLRAAEAELANAGLESKLLKQKRQGVSWLLDSIEAAHMAHVPAAAGPHGPPASSASTLGGTIAEPQLAEAQRVVSEQVTVTAARLLWRVLQTESGPDMPRGEATEELFQQGGAELLVTVASSSQTGQAGAIGPAPIAAALLPLHALLSSLQTTKHVLQSGLVDACWSARRGSHADHLDVAHAAAAALEAASAHAYLPSLSPTSSTTSLSPSKALSTASITSQDSLMSSSTTPTIVAVLLIEAAAPALLSELLQIPHAATSRILTRLALTALARLASNEEVLWDLVQAHGLCNALQSTLAHHGAADEDLALCSLSLLDATLQLPAACQRFLQMGVPSLLWELRKVHNHNQEVTATTDRVLEQLALHTQPPPMPAAAAATSTASSRNTGKAAENSKLTAGTGTDDDEPEPTARELSLLPLSLGPYSGSRPSPPPSPPSSSPPPLDADAVDTDAAPPPPDEAPPELQQPRSKRGAVRRDSFSTNYPPLDDPAMSELLREVQSIKWPGNGNPLDLSPHLNTPEVPSEDLRRITRRLTEEIKELTQRHAALSGFRIELTFSAHQLVTLDVMDGKFPRMLLVLCQSTPPTNLMHEEQFRQTKKSGKGKKKPAAKQGGVSESEEEEQEQWYCIGVTERSKAGGQPVWKKYIEVEYQGRQDARQFRLSLHDVSHLSSADNTKLRRSLPFSDPTEAALVLKGYAPKIGAVTLRASDLADFTYGWPEDVKKREDRLLQMDSEQKMRTGAAGPSRTKMGGLASSPPPAAQRAEGWDNNTDMRAPPMATIRRPLRLRRKYRQRAETMGQQPTITIVCVVRDRREDQLQELHQAVHKKRAELCQRYAASLAAPRKVRPASDGKHRPDQLGRPGQSSTTLTKGDTASRGRV
eukprot:g11330.t1